MRLLFAIILSTVVLSSYAQPFNPVLNKDFPDPTVIRVGSVYYAYATNSGPNIQLASSKDLQHWNLLPDAMPQKPLWADKDFWAPHVLFDSSLKKFVLFY